LAERPSCGSRSLQASKVQLEGRYLLGRVERKTCLEWKVVGISEKSRISPDGEIAGQRSRWSLRYEQRVEQFLEGASTEARG
jgi:hypothetical protein